MTDSDIIQSMKSCANDTTCAKCLYQQHYQNGCCQSKLIGDALEVFQQQQEELERLTINMNAFGLGMKTEAERANRLETEKDALIRNQKECVMEAVKDFAERLKEKAYTARTEWSHGKYLLVVEVDDIDALVAEMESENGRT